MQPGALALTIGALVVLLLVIIVIESAALQWLRWAGFKRSLRASLLMNLASTPISLLGLVLAPILGIWGLLISGVLAVIIETLVLRRLKPDAGPLNGWAALAANLASYLILLFPIFRFASV
jgi:hypothetical protein